MVKTTNRYKGFANQYPRSRSADGVEVNQMFAGMGPVAGEQSAQIPLPARSANGCHAALFMDK
jgi:hypothetical protein